ncbi:hypothetical protein AGMMS50230_04310 [Spirochaetia bacterium]|nr:hypothetical protein AGMMS50230_04310 [Spirochaetia bacterium]
MFQVLMWFRKFAPRNSGWIPLWNRSVYWNFVRWNCPVIQYFENQPGRFPQMFQAPV